MKHKGYRAPAGELAGVKTFLTNDSQKGLPPDTVSPSGEKENKADPDKSEPRERALPESSSRSKDKDRKIPQPHVRAPIFKDQDSDMGDVKIKPRTLNKPGEEYGTPSKDDYGVITRRTMTGKKKQNPNRRRRPKKRRRRPSSTGQVRFRPKKRQKKQRGQKKMKSRGFYRKKKNKYKMKAKLRYKRNKAKTWFKKNQQIRQKNPERFKRRFAEVLVTPEIAFAMGKDHNLGYVRGLSPMTGNVHFWLEGPPSSLMHSLPLNVFLCSVVFLSESDIDAMFNLVDIELGDRAFIDITPEAVERALEFYGVTLDDEFFDACFDLVGEDDLYEMDEDQLFAVDDAILYGMLPEQRGSEEPEDAEEDATHIDETDDNYYFGEVAYPPRSVRPSAQRVASAHLVATFYREEKAPQDWDQNFGKPDVENKFQGVPGSPTWLRGEPQDNQTPAHKLHLTEVTGPGSSAKVIPDRNTDLVNKKDWTDWKKNHNKEALSAQEIQSQTGRDIRERARDYRPQLFQSDEKKQTYVFKVGSHRVRVKPKQKVSSLVGADLLVQCNCSFWQYQGPEHWAKVGGYLFGKPKGTATKPSERDPRGHNRCCKHVYAVLEDLEKFVRRG